LLTYVSVPIKKQRGRDTLIIILDVNRKNS
jgi:hypothetical protein